MGVSVDVAKCVRTGSLTLIKDAKRDEVYECYDCGYRLIPKMGIKRRHHFAHLSGEGSRKCCQTAVHIMAKMAFQDMSVFRLPSVTLDEPFFNSGIFIDILKSEVVEVKSVTLEKSAGDFIPDITLETNKGTLLVEIYVSHKVDEDKLQKIRKAGINTIEIDLSKEDRDLSYDDIKQLIETGKAKARWVFNKDLERLREVQNSHKVYMTHSSIKTVDCPLLQRGNDGLYFLDKIVDCSGCPFFHKGCENGKDACYAMSFCACIDDVDTSYEEREAYWKKVFEETLKDTSLRLRRVVDVCDEFSTVLDLDSSKLVLSEIKRYRFRFLLSYYTGLGRNYAYANNLGDVLMTAWGDELECHNCHSPIVLRRGRFGYFGGCKGFSTRDCRVTYNLFEV